MAKRRSNFRRKKSYSKRKRAVVRRTAKKTRRIVRKQIFRAAETKSQQEYVFGSTLKPTTDSTFDSSNIFACGPRGTSLPIVQGTGQGNRIGNSIQAKRLTIRGAIIPQPYNVTTNPLPRPLLVTVYFLYDKTNPLAPPTPLTNGDFFQNGNGAATFDTDMLDGVAPVNTDRYHIFKRKSFKVGFSAYEGSGIQPAQQAYSNNDFKMTQRFSFDITRYHPKRIKFNDNVSTPTTRPVWMMWMANYADGNAIPAAVRPCFIQWIQDFRYTDV